MTAGLLAFIPLYPKLPLINVIRTWVYIRLEDFFVLAALSCLAYNIIKNRKIPGSPLTAPIVTYWIIGLFSAAISILFIGPHLADYFPHLAILHYLRRIEYMGVFFLAYLGVAKNKRLGPIILTLAVTAVLIVIYGIGQKYLGWPAFLTMNEEFAKGIPLRLPPTARIPSTFGGHYDLAAYLVLVLPVMASLVIGMKRWWQKGIFSVITLGMLVMLLYTASRVSFGVYLIAVSCMLVWQKKVWLVLPVVIGSIIFMNFVSGTSERFAKTFRMSDVIVDLSTGRPVGTLDTLEGGKAIVSKEESPAVENLPKGSEFVNIPTQTGQPSKTVKTIEFFKSRSLATGSGEIATISGSFLIQKALVYDISITTRIQGEWPKAVAAFKRNILTGSGYSTLSVATDGDYMRMLGETGILGTIAFLGIFLFAFALFFRTKDVMPSVERSFVIGVFAGIIGIALNGILIDVFEASKVAYSLWMLLGVAIAVMSRYSPATVPYRVFLFRVMTSLPAYMLYIVILVFLVYDKALGLYFMGDDFTWLKWAATSSFSDIPRYFRDSGGFFYRPLPKLWYLLLYTVFWLKPFAYHLASVVLFAVISVFLYLVQRLLNVRNSLALFFTVFFISLSVHHENVFWISGQSSLLAAVFFSIGLPAFILSWQGSDGKSRFWRAVGWLCLLLSMASYEGALLVPASVWLIGLTVFRRRSATDAAVLLLIPLYWLIRQTAHALPPSGDYGVNTVKLPLNFLGNGMAYISAVFAGYPAIEWWMNIRQVLKQNISPYATVGLGVMAVSAGLLYRLRKSWQRLSPVLAWLAAFVVIMVPFLGLGGLAERYLILGSMMLVMALSVLAERLCLSGKYGTVLAFLSILLLLGLKQFQDLERAGNDWQTASSISQDTLLAIKTEYFPLSSDKSFIFINPPIRYGRAWIFPTGLSDALWHMFRFNAYSYVTETASSIPEAYAIPLKLGYGDYFAFENNKLVKVEKDVRYVEEGE